MTDAATAEYLSGHDFFSGFSEEIRQLLWQCSTSREIKKDQILFVQGDIADKFYVIRTGLMSIQVPAIMGPTLEIETLGMDQVLGWSWLIPPYRWHFQTSALEDSELLEFDGTRLLARCEQDPKFGYELLKKFAGLMSERLNAARKKIMEEWSPNGFA